MHTLQNHCSYYLCGYVDECCVCVWCMCVSVCVCGPEEVHMSTEQALLPTESSLNIYFLIFEEIFKCFKKHFYILIVQKQS